MQYDNRFHWDVYKKEVESMSKYKIGFIGCGNMGRAMMAGALDTGWATANQIAVHTHSQATMERIADEYSVEICANNRTLAANADIIVLAVKPNIYKEVLEDIRSVLCEGQIVIAIAPAYTIASIACLVENEGVRIARAMPNTPAQIGEGMTGLTFSANMDVSERELVQSFFESFGKVRVVREDTMAAVGSVSGSSPAFVYMVIEAMAEGAIKLGIPAKDAYTFAAQSVLGSAKMVLETGQHPAVLRDAVCSAGGTTIEGVAVLEKDGLKAALIEAMDQTADKFLAMQEQARRSLD